MYTFKLVTLYDLKMLYIWLNYEHVCEFWDDSKGMIFDQFKEVFKQKLLDKNVKMYIIYLNCNPIGMIQRYYELPSEKYELNETAIGIDLFIGEIEFCYAGFGPRIIRNFIKKHVFNHDEINFCVIDPNIRNEKAVKAFNRVGFKGYKEYQKEDIYLLMKLSRDDFYL